FQMNIQKSYEELEGFPNWYRTEETYLTYTAPPEELGFSFKKRPQEDVPKRYWIDAWGSGVGGGVDFDTNAGSLNYLTTSIAPIPAGTPDDPGISTCIGPTNMYCGDHNLANFGSGQVSAKVAVNSPIHLRLELSVKKTRAYVDADISEFLEFSKEVSHEYANSTAVYLDTHGTPIAAQLRVWDDDDLSTVLKVPPNTRAIDRYVEIENSGVNNDRNRGQLMCPYGFDAHVWAAWWELSLNDDLCSTSVLTSVANNVIPADGLPHVVDLYGWAMVDQTFDGSTYHDGTRVHLSPSPNFSGPAIPYPMWLAVDHIQITVTLNPGDEGEYYFSLENPTSEHRRSQETPAACTCKLIVMPA
ncbi:MAG: hypothetical protein H0U92_12655, partial [Actinobacteria bacterium]|nr:hypothetical protein [Actinomycetota bacterium]